MLPGTSEVDDEELIAAASQAEAQLNTGVAYDTNFKIVQMFSDSKKYCFAETSHILKYTFCLQYRAISHQAGCIISVHFFQTLRLCTKVSCVLFVCFCLPLQSPVFLLDRIMHDL